MDMAVQEKNGVRIAVVRGEEQVLADTQSALDLMATVHHTHGCGCMVVFGDCVPPAFFDLKTGIAGEILQKYTNYGMRLAIVGDFTGIQSKSLRDFIRESNRGGKVLFLPSEEEALDALSRG